MLKQCLLNKLDLSVYLCTAQVVIVHVNADARLTFGGTDDAAGLAHLYSAGCLEPEKNNSYAKTISEHLQKHFSIPVGR